MKLDQLLESKRFEYTEAQQKLIDQKFVTPIYKGKRVLVVQVAPGIHKGLKFKEIVWEFSAMGIHDLTLAMVDPGYNVYIISTKTNGYLLILPPAPKQITRSLHNIFCIPSPGEVLPLSNVVQAVPELLIALKMIERKHASLTESLRGSLLMGKWWVVCIKNKESKESMGRLYAPLIYLVKSNTDKEAERLIQHSQFIITHQLDDRNKYHWYIVSLGRVCAAVSSKKVGTTGELLSKITKGSPESPDNLPHGSIVTVGWDHPLYNWMKSIVTRTR